MTRTKLVTVVAAALLLGACTAWSGPGVFGGIGLLLLLLFVGGAQSGCIEDKPDPDPEDAMVGPCLTDAGPYDAYIGPCLSIEDDASITPCLGALLEDAGPDAYLGPCLQPPQEDFGPPVIDAEPDAPLGPCLDIEPDAGSASLDRPAPAYAHASTPDPRSRILDRLIDEGRLPDDVAERLKRRS